MPKSAYDIIKRPLLTEKSTKSKDKFNSYCFQVDIHSNKAQIKKAIEEVFPAVKVEKVKTMIIKGKPKRAKTFIMHQTDWKKAIVTLKEGNRIDII